jgi:hypothetical protein
MAFIRLERASLLKQYLPAFPRTAESGKLGLRPAMNLPQLFPIGILQREIVVSEP